MPLNQIKTYPDLLELGHLSGRDRAISLQKIFERDIENNNGFAFRGKEIRPVKKEGKDKMAILFEHLTCEAVTETNPDGSKFKRRYFEIDRASRIHWILPHINETANGNIIVFSIEERDVNKRIDVVRTYIYNETRQYVVVLEPKKNDNYYFLLTAYYLNKKWGIKEMAKKMKSKLDDIL